MIITNEIKKDMKEENNPQWHATYPLEEDFQKDIDNESLYVLEENNELKAFAAIMEDLEDDYEQVENRTKAPSIIIHRLAVNTKDRQKGYAQELFSFAEQLAQQKNINCIKADTEIHNQKMNRLFQKLGYQKKGVLEWSDNDGVYNYYKKKLGSD